MTGLPEPEFERALAAARVPPADLRAPATTRRGVGVACHGRLRAYARDDRLAGLEVDRALLSLTAGELSCHVLTAVNAALTSARAGRMVDEVDRSPDSTAMLEMLEAAQTEILSTMTRVSVSIQDAIARVGERTGLRGDPASRDLEHLLVQTMTVVRSQVDSRSGARPYSVGVDPQGLVRVELSSLRRLRAVQISPPAMQLAPSKLAEQLVVAINSAVDAGPIASDEEQQRSRDSLRAAAELTRRVQGIQAQSLDHMRDYTRSLCAIMTTIQDP